MKRKIVFLMLTCFLVVSAVALSQGWLSDFFKSPLAKAAECVAGANCSTQTYLRDFGELTPRTCSFMVGCEGLGSSWCVDGESCTRQCCETGESIFGGCLENCTGWTCVPSTYCFWECGGCAWSCTADSDCGPGCTCDNGRCINCPTGGGGTTYSYSCTGLYGSCAEDEDGSYRDSNCEGMCPQVFKPTIVLIPSSFTFSGVSGGSTPAGQTMTVSNTGNAQLNWISATNQGWCHISAASGVLAAGTSQNVTVSVDAPSNIGTFNCTIAVSDPNATNDPQTASVVYTVAVNPQAICDSTWRFIPGRPIVSPLPVSPVGNPVIDFLPPGYLYGQPSNKIAVAQVGITGGMSWDDLYTRMAIQWCDFSGGISNMCTWRNSWGVDLMSGGKVWQDSWAQFRSPFPGIHSETAAPNNWNVYSPMTNCGEAGVNCTFRWNAGSITNIGDVPKPWGTPISEPDPAGRTWEVRRSGLDYEYRCTPPAPPPPTASSVTVTEPDYCNGPGIYVSWTYSSPVGSPQSAFQVQIDDTGSAWNAPYIVDTGKVSGAGTSYFASGLDFNITYKARVRVWDSNDSVSAWKESGSWKTPKHAYPLVDFTYSPSTDIPAKQPVQFTDQTTFYDGGGTRTWSWLFKAPAPSPSSNQQNPTYTYNDPGAYQVSETATDKDGYTCPRTKTINIGLPVPVWKEVSPR